MKKVIMSIGVPGSGKTTALKPFAEENEYVYISPDEIRAEMAGNEINQTKNKEVWEEAHRRVVDALGAGETVVFDATFARDNERKAFIEFVREHGAEKVQGVFSAVGYEIAAERNRGRERAVPEHAMERMHSMLRSAPPVVEDGFDGVFDIDELQQLRRAEIRDGEEVVVKEFKPKFH